MELEVVLNDREAFAAIQDERMLWTTAGSQRAVTLQQPHGMVTVRFAFEVRLPDGTLAIAQHTITGRELETLFRLARAAHPNGQWCDSP